MFVQRGLPTTTIVDQDGGVAQAAAVSTGHPSDFVALLKPRVMSLVVLTALTGLMIAPGHMNPVLGLASLLAIAVGAGASGALNMWYDADVDRLMRRTRMRPIPAGKVRAAEALAFGLILAVLSVFALGLVANWFAAGFLAFTIFFYAVVYTMWLKRWTPQNIVIGGAAGAFPPMIGYAAATGTVSLEGLVLFAIIFVWTPPHFWSLALVKASEYASAGLPMMPNVHGADYTRLQILLYTLILAPLGCLPWLLGFGGAAYGLVSGSCGAVMLHRAWRTYRVRDGINANRTAMRLFGFSILYVFALFSVLLIEHVVAMLAVKVG